MFACDTVSKGIHSWKGRLTVTMTKKVEDFEFLPWDTCISLL
jgi:hypothetical protein